MRHAIKNHPKFYHGHHRSKKNRTKERRVSRLKKLSKLKNER